MKFRKAMSVLMIICMVVSISPVSAFADAADPEGPHVHSYSLVETIEPTCTDGGHSVFSCECGDSYTDYTDPLGHDWDEGSVTLEPTTENDGIRTFRCVRCGCEMTENIGKLPEDASEDLYTADEEAVSETSGEPGPAEESFPETQEDSEADDENASPELPDNSETSPEAEDPAEKSDDQGTEDTEDPHTSEDEETSPETTDKADNGDSSDPSGQKDDTDKKDSSSENSASGKKTDDTPSKAADKIRNSDKKENAEKSDIRAVNATAPTVLYVEPTETNGIPAQIDLFKAQTGGSSWSPTYTYQLYLPGGADLSNCYLSWDGNAQATVDNKTYDSGSCPVPSLNTEKPIPSRAGPRLWRRLKSLLIRDHHHRMYSRFLSK